MGARNSRPGIRKFKNFKIVYGSADSDVVLCYHEIKRQGREAVQEAAFLPCFMQRHLK